MKKCLFFMSTIFLLMCGFASIIAHTQPSSSTDIKPLPVSNQVLKCYGTITVDTTTAEQSIDIAFAGSGVGGQQLVCPGDKVLLGIKNIHSSGGSTGPVTWGDTYCANLKMDVLNCRYVTGP